MLHAHDDAGLVICLVIVVGVPGSPAVGLHHEEPIVVLQPCLHVRCTALVAVERSQAIVPIVHVRRNTIFSCLDDEHCSIVLLAPHYHCLLTHRSLSRQRLVVQWRSSVFDLLSDRSRDVLLVNSLGLDVIFINFLPL